MLAAKNHVPQSLDGMALGCAESGGIIFYSGG